MARNPWSAILDTDCIPCNRARASAKDGYAKARQGDLSGAAKAVRQAANDTGRAFTLKAGKIQASFTRGR